jgi:hypothetical protein
MDSLHPNLARIAAAYDHIVERFRRGELTPLAARAEILALAARDDEGTIWSIDPDTGAWLRRTVLGDVVPDTPPTYGLPTVTPFDLSHNPGAFNPDERIHFAPVDESTMLAPNSFRGATRRTVVAARRSWVTVPAWARQRRTHLVAVVITVVVLAFAWSHVENPEQIIAPLPGPIVQVPSIGN